MSTKRDSDLSPKFSTLSRRRMLEGLGAIAATTACGGTDTNNGPGAGGTANSTGGTGGGTGSSPLSGSGPGGSPMATGGTPVSMGGGTPVGGAAGATGTAQGGGGASAVGGTGAVGGATGAAGAGMGGAGSLPAPTFEDVPEYCEAAPTMCKASPTDGAGQGPFFIHDLEKDNDISLFRQDIRGRYNMDAAPGIEMQLHVRLLTSAGMACEQTPVPDADIYIWHTDGQGYYSGFGTRGMPNEQKPDTPYMGQPDMNALDTTDRFCRGAQTTSANGIVSFRSIFPGWYNGRVLHIHLVAFKKGSTSLGRRPDYSKSSSPQWLYTTQFYFDKDFVRSVHEKYDPYKGRIALPDYTKSINSGTISDIMKAGAGQNCLGTGSRTEGSSSGLIANASIANDIVTARMNILIKS